MRGDIWRQNHLLFRLTITAPDVITEVASAALFKTQRYYPIADVDPLHYGLLRRHNIYLQLLLFQIYRRQILCRRCSQPCPNSLTQRADCVFCQR